MYFNFYTFGQIVTIQPQAGLCSTIIFNLHIITGRQEAVGYLIWKL